MSKKKKLFIKGHASTKKLGKKNILNYIHCHEILCIYNRLERMIQF